MTQKHRSDHRPVRPIRTKRDYAGAATAIKNMSGRTAGNSAAELRLQSLLRELDKFDDPEDDASTEDDTSTDFPGDSIYSGPRRRWSDDASGAG